VRTDDYELIRYPGWVLDRAQTSYPIMLRAGFTDFGQQRRHRLAIG
jgi:hypothetical protein